jgi:subtilase-type serine protease
LGYGATDTAPHGIWGRWISLYDHTDGDAALGSPSSHATTGGFQTGYDYVLDENLLLGVSGGYSDTNLTVDDRGSSGKSKSIQGGLYTHYNPNPWFLNGSVGYTDLTNDNSRFISFPGVSEVANASFKSHIVTLFGEAGVNLDTAYRVSVSPSLSLRQSFMHQDGYTETGAPGLNLMVDDDSSQSLVSALGVRLGREFHPGRTHTLTAGVRTAWEHELDNTDTSVTVQFAQAPGPTFTSRGTPRKRDAAVVGLDLNFELKKDLHLFTDYSYTASTGRYTHALMGGLSWRF